MSNGKHSEKSENRGLVIPLREATAGKPKALENIAAAAAAPIGTARSWYYDGVMPRGDALIRLMAAFPQVRDAVLMQVGVIADYRPGDVAHVHLLLTGADAP